MKKIQVTVVFFISILLVISILSIIYQTIYQEILFDKDFSKNILVELSSIAIELLLLGIFLTVFIDKISDAEEIDKLKKELDYLRFLRTDEAKYKTVGIIRQLNKKKIYDLPLRQCHLSDVRELSTINLSASTLHAVNFSHSTIKESTFNKARGERVNFVGSTLTGSKFRECVFLRADFTDSNSRSVTFSKSQLQKSDFENSDLLSSKFMGCDLKEGNFTGAILRRCDFRGANLEQVKFDGADVHGAIFTNARNFNIAQLATAINTGKAIF